MFQLQHLLGLTLVFTIIIGIFLQIGFVPMGISFAVCAGLLCLCSGLKYLNG